jgi:hypothetical protein
MTANKAKLEVGEENHTSAHGIVAQPVATGGGHAAVAVSDPAHPTRLLIGH